MRAVAGRQSPGGEVLVADLPARSMPGIGTAMPATRDSVPDAFLRSQCPVAMKTGTETSRPVSITPLDLRQMDPEVVLVWRKSTSVSPRAPVHNTRAPREVYIKACGRGHLTRQSLSGGRLGNSQPFSPNMSANTNLLLKTPVARAGLKKLLPALYCGNALCATSRAGTFTCVDHRCTELMERDR